MSHHSLAGTQSYCFGDAAKRAGVNKDILISIAMVESDLNRAAVHKNNNGTEDVGVMQINSSHFGLLKSVGIKRNDLFNACINIHVAALILKESMQIQGSTWAAVGAYNAGHSKSKRAEQNRRLYANKVWEKYKRLKAITG
ncbi:MAG: lytic transglycosylase domain-containing protein [Sideroxydans sp.]|nr:lytic transglycosylase domain-containing protein [Sideroxydans sp.]MDD5056637.1 lytic transglycosylase domain-containing protein [Sideroxydans sp.]